MIQTHLKPNTYNVPKYFFVGDRHPQVLHTCIHTKCSALNYEIYLKNFTDTPLCRCGNIETSEHLFLQCRYYHRQILEMIQTISLLCHITFDVLLFRGSSLSTNTNKSIYTAVQKFVKNKITEFVSSKYGYISYFTILFDFSTKPCVELSQNGRLKAPT